MAKTSFKANIKKIEISNRILAAGNTQTIRVILDEIELSDKNLTQLRKFKPNETVNVEIMPIQLDIEVFSLLGGDENEN